MVIIRIVRLFIELREGVGYMCLTGTGADYVMRCLYIVELHFSRLSCSMDYWLLAVIDVICWYLVMLLWFAWWFLSFGVL